MKNKIYNGNSLSILRLLPSNSIDCCVTSPPYWGLRAYLTNPVIWDDDKNCDHEWVDSPPRRSRKESDVIDSNSKQATNTGANCNLIAQNFCTKCGAWKGELGAEPTPELFVKHITDIFREVRRVLKPTGVLWLNLGDSYAGGGGSSGHTLETKNMGRKTNSYGSTKTAGRVPLGLKPKDLVGIPWMCAFALRADGWWLRQDIIWHKPNPMPESVTDRCTKAHEYIFLFSKSKKYYYDNEAIWEKANYDGRKDTIMKGSEKYKNGYSPSDNNPQSIAKVGHERWVNNKDGVPMRNKRSVWTVNTKPFKEAHFAVFPEALIVDCIKAGCPEGGLVLDPFMGAGTTALVAKKLNRNYVGIELNESYIEIANKRLDNYKPKIKHEQLDLFNK